jgi:hypothetical protein
MYVSNVIAVYLASGVKLYNKYVGYILLGGFEMKIRSLNHNTNSTLFVCTCTSSLPGSSLAFQHLSGYHVEEPTSREPFSYFQDLPSPTTIFLTVSAIFFHFLSVSIRLFNPVPGSGLSSMQLLSSLLMSWAHYN